MIWKICKDEGLGIVLVDSVRLSVCAHKIGSRAVAPSCAPMLRKVLPEHVLESSHEPL